MSDPTFIYHDGGRPPGAKPSGDCVTRSIAIATGIPYAAVARALGCLAQRERPRAGRRRSDPNRGVRRVTYDRYLASLGWVWYPTMGIGTGCRVHLRQDELPDGRLIVRLSRHLTAVINGIVYDTFDPSRNGTRCVYGYWRKAP